jgi:catechol 2,3-dioxygenase-like lactoylglutathione lyase family enzyme
MTERSTLMISRPQFGFVVEYVSDVEQARRFYTDVLGLEVERYHPTYVQFDHFAIASDESLGGKREPEVYWLVEDVEEAFREVAAHAEVVLPIRVMPFGKVFEVRDPSGHPQFMLELSSNRPSQAVG